LEQGFIKASWAAVIDILDRGLRLTVIT